MRPGGGKAKGAAFERQICKQLSLWMSHNKREDLFWRSAMSGGRATLLTKQGRCASAQEGDISAIHNQGMPLTALFVIECKRVRDLNVASSLFLRVGLYRTFWLEVQGKAERSGKLPMLVWQQNRWPPYVSLSHLGADVFFPALPRQAALFEDALLVPLARLLTVRQPRARLKAALVNRMR
jgi:hypothetical protein